LRLFFYFYIKKRAQSAIETFADSDYADFGVKSTSLTKVKKQKEKGGKEK